MNTLAERAAWQVEVEFAQQARALMARQGRTVGWLAGELGLSYRQVNRCLTGASKISLARAAAIARALGMELWLTLGACGNSETGLWKSKSQPPSRAAKGLG
jgi:plasmid maintenance system antidote protein VapI